MKPGISVILCCHNSEKKIAATLEHLAIQEPLAGGSWEVILVDNVCTDNTVNLARKVWDERKLPAPLRVIREEKPGLSNARLAGINVAEHSLSCFCDDDNWLHANYLALAFTHMEHHAETGVLGGRGIAYADTFIPAWFNDRQAIYACGPQASRSGEPTTRWLWGAGMVVRTAYIRALYAAGFRHLNEDRKLDSLSSGGDTEICFWHLITGKKLWYDDNLLFTHWITRDRLTTEIADRMEKQHDISYHNLAPYFPLVYGDQYIGRNKISVFLQALRMKSKGEDISPLAVHLRPFFDSALGPATREVLRKASKFRSSNKA